ncbi:MAG: histidine phosphatase family protein [Chromatiaceae bacterium]|nr:histidine phosphatase family protein [Chromatiaceae bacterium]MCP5315321.1 histidine phosphatase family protein [Chromatiaceae bacterium]
MRVIGLRHGQSSYNVRRLCNDDPRRRVDLTALGMRQAQRAAARLAAEPIEQVFSSPLLRAEHTARIVAAPLGLPVKIDERLADIRSGCDGRPVDEFLGAIAGDPVDGRVGDGESLREYQQRLGGFLVWLEAQPWQCVLLVAHEESLRILDAHYSKRDLLAVVGRPFANCIPYFFQSPSEN